MKLCLFLTLFLSFSIFGSPKVCNSKVGNALGVNGTIRPQPNIFFAMTRLFKGKKFDDIRRSIPDLIAMGINTIWISPPNPQTVEFTERWGFNNHGYWVSSHAKIAPELGGEAAFVSLVNAAKKEGMRVVVDAVLNQFGYASEFEIGGKKIQHDDPEYFIPHVGEFQEIKKSAHYLLDRLDSEIDPVMQKKYKRELEQLPLYDFPTLRTSNPEVFRHLVESYKKFVDRGVEMFRIDAAKHLPLEFISQFVNELNDYAKLRGSNLTFIFESIGYDSYIFSSSVKEMMASVKDPQSIMYFDFPLRAELVKLQEPSYRFDWMMSFFKYRILNRHPMKRYIPIIEDHDFGYPIRNRFYNRLTHLVTEFFSYNPAVMYQGTEQSGVASETRQHITDVNPHGDIAEMRASLAEVLKPYRTNHAKPQLVSYLENLDQLVVENRLPNNRSLFLAVNKGSSEFKKRIKLPKRLSNTSDINVILRDQEVGVKTLNHGIEIEVSVGPNSFMVFEVTNVF